MAEYIVGVDLGGTQIRAVVQDERGQIVARAATLTRAGDGRDAVIGRILDCAREAVGSLSWREIKGVGIGAPGPLDPWQGIVMQSPNLPGWVDVPLRQIISDALGVPTQLGNDANLAALGEYHFGAGRGVPDLIYMTISTGIGGGIITQGQLLLGAGGLAGEVGHQTLSEDGPPCGCGNVGCLEALAAGPAIGRMGREAAAAGRGARLLELAGGNVEAIDAKVVAQAALAGDETACAIIRRSAVWIGIGLANLIHLFNPRLILLGGGVTHVGALLFDPIRATIARRAMPSMREVRVEAAALGDDVVLMGALALFAGVAGKG
jgi:glucokinase